MVNIKRISWSRGVLNRVKEIVYFILTRTFEAEFLMQGSNEESRIVSNNTGKNCGEGMVDSVSKTQLVRVLSVNSL